MKLLLTAVLTQFFAVAHAQIEELSDDMKNEIEIEAARLKDSLSANIQDGYSNPELVVAFSVDTFKIEQMCLMKLEINYSTNGMVNAFYEATADYSELLDKLYDQLLSKLNERDKEILRTSRQNWATFCEHEVLLFDKLGANQYCGGGSNQSLIAAKRMHLLTKGRVIQLFDLLLLCK